MKFSDTLTDLNLECSFFDSVYCVTKISLFEDGVSLFFGSFIGSQKRFA